MGVVGHAAAAWRGMARRSSLNALQHGVSSTLKWSGTARHCGVCMSASVRVSKSDMEVVDQVSQRSSSCFLSSLSTLFAS